MLSASTRPIDCRRLLRWTRCRTVSNTRLRWRSGAGAPRATIGGRAVESVKAKTITLASAKKLSVFDCQIDPLTKSEAVNLIWSWMQDPSGFRYIVTPNVHHLVLLRKCRLLREAYRQASLTLVDGRPVTWALNLLGDPVPEVVPGSDLVPTLFSSASRHRILKVFLLGAAAGVAAKAENVIRANWPFVDVVGAYSPRRCFESDEVELAAMLRMVREAAPDLLIIGLGCPKQETWVWRFRSEINARVAICCGATIDFIAGRRKRAPMWIRKIGCEWLFRVLSEPIRLGPRYANDAVVFPVIVVSELWKRWRDGDKHDRSRRNQAEATGRARSASRNVL
ncbi:MAG: WecB/TagA/CpsF family glycosyltransferase [Bacteroidota bacterium]